MKNYNILKKYNIQNYNRYQKDLKETIAELPSVFFDEYSRDQLISKFMPLTENLARKFATSHQAIGVLSINDLIQFGHIGLINAVDKLDWMLLRESKDIEQTLKSFLSKRIKGHIRRSINANMGDIKIPEWKLTEIRKDPVVNSLLSKSKSMYIGDVISKSGDDGDYELDIPDESEDYNVDLMNSYLIALLDKHLESRESEVIRMSYGLDCPKFTLSEIADVFLIKGSTKQKAVRISEIKREALAKLVTKTNDSQLPDLL